MKTAATIELRESFFEARETRLVEGGELSAVLFRFPGGVPAVRLENSFGSAVLLPFQGQQIWSAEFAGRDLTMRSMFREPRATRSYLETYGGFLLHCGATAMGVPSREDVHPLHGELPNAPYGRAWLVLGEEDGTPFVALRGEYEHAVAFTAHYAARPEVRLAAGETRLRASMTIENLKRTPMELMYLAHVNFRPVDGGRLVSTAPCIPGETRVRTSIPSHVRPGEGYRAFLEELQVRPERHLVLEPGLPFDPEVVFFLRYRADEDGRAHSLQVHPDGSADFISHRPDQLPHGIRWICRTPDQDALGLCLPATAEPEGYLAEKKKGNIRELPAGGTARFDLEMGCLGPAEAQEMERRIEEILARSI
jgi:hypothetical protein